MMPKCNQISKILGKEVVKVVGLNQPVNADILRLCIYTKDGWVYLSEYEPSKHGSHFELKQNVFSTKLEIIQPTNSDSLATVLRASSLFGLWRVDAGEVARIMLMNNPAAKKKNWF